MCINEGDSCEGQLAVVDAMVFFCISMLISSLLISAVTDVGGRIEAHCGGWDPDQVLSVFLRATFDSGSLGNRDAQDLFRGVESVAEVLLALALLAEDNRLPECYDEIAYELLDAVRSIAHPSLEPHISVLALEDGAPSKLLVIEDSEVPESGDIMAASQRLEGCEEKEMVAVLTLSVSSPSHLVCVPLG